MPNAKDKFNGILKLTNSKISYSSITRRLDEILAKKDTERNELLKNYYIELSGGIYRHAVNYRMEEGNKPTKAGEDINFNLVNDKLPEEVALALYELIAETDPEAIKGLSLDFGSTHEQRRDVILNVTRDHNALDGLRREARERSMDILSVPVDSLLGKVQRRREFTQFDPESTTTFHVGVAETYIYWKEKKAEYEKQIKRNPIWRFFNRGVIKKNREFIHKCEDILAATNFDEKTHGAMIENKFASEAYNFLKFDAEMANQNYENAIRKLVNEEKKNTIEQLTVARDKVKKAEAMNKDKANSLAAKWKPYLDKYGIPHEGNNGITTNFSSLTSAAEAFDVSRDTGMLKNTVQQRFLYFYTRIVEHALSDGREIDMRDILDDTQKVMEIEVDYATIINEHPEAKTVADDISAYADVSEKVLKDKLEAAIFMHNKNAVEPIPKERIVELKASIDTIVGSAREANKKRVEEMENKRAGEKNMSDGDKKKNDTVENKNDMKRQQIPIQMSDGGGVIETAPMIKHEPNVIESVVQKT